MGSKEYVLGMDIGTTSVKVCILDAQTKEIVAKQNKDTAANIPSDQGTEGNKQDVPKIISAVHGCVVRLPKDLLKHVTKIGVCGQMHGIMLWRNDADKAWERVEKDNALVRYDAIRERVSALYTWQDTRCKSEFLESLPKPDSHLKCYSGYGCATMLWLAANKPDKFKQYNRAATIQDFIVAILCGLDVPIMSDQNAASWGYFNTESLEWNIDILKRISFPITFLPNIKMSGQVAGELSENWYGIPAGTPVGVALGDLQCSFLATLEQPTDAVLNVSTSAQLGFVVKAVGPSYETVEYLPYFNKTHLAVAASLNGGNALATFVKMLQQWLLELGFSAPQSKVWEKLISHGLEESASPLMTINPFLLGERHNPDKRASVTNINLANLGLGQVFRSLCEGLIGNLHSMMPREILLEAEIKRIVGNGSGLSRNAVLQKAVEHFYNLPLEFTSGGDAARGAAIAMMI